jgi:hypothetical protein
MSPVMARANQRIPQQGDYLDKDELIRDQEPMGIASVAFDSVGSNFGPRWIVSVQPWFEGQDGPTGLITFTNNATRTPLFEDLQAQIEENGNEPIGPVVLIKGKSQQGYRFYTFGDWDEPQAVAAVSAPPTRPARPTVAPEPTPATSEPAKRKPGRPRKAETAAPSSPAASEAVKPPERPLAAPSQTLNVGKAICPDCQQEVTGRVLSDEKGNQVIIHPHCPATGKAGVVAIS